MRETTVLSPPPSEAGREVLLIPLSTTPLPEEDHTEEGIDGKLAAAVAEAHAFATMLTEGAVKMAAASNAKVSHMASQILPSPPAVEEVELSPEQRLKQARSRCVQALKRSPSLHHASRNPHHAPSTSKRFSPPLAHQTQTKASPTLVLRALHNAPCTLHPRNDPPTPHNSTPCFIMLPQRSASLHRTPHLHTT